MNSLIKSLGGGVEKIENFFTPEHLDRVKELQRLAVDVNGESYAGRRAKVPSSILDIVLKNLKEIGRTNLKIIGSRMRVVSGHDDDQFHSLIHVDNNCDQALVIYIENDLYLNPLEAGTQFWEHKKTNKRLMNLRDGRERILHSMILEKESIKLQKWNPWLKVPFEENSAILFNSLLFHSPPSPENEKLRTGKRVTLDVFFEEV